MSKVNDGAAFAKDFELYISNRGNAKNVHTQAYELKEN